MKVDRSRRLMLLSLTGGFALAVLAVLVAGHKDALLSLTRRVWRIPELPNAVWWFTGTAVLSLWGTGLVLRLLKALLSKRRNSSPVAPFQGRVASLHSELCNGLLQGYSRDKVRDALRSVAVGLCALMGDGSDEEARRRVLRGDWPRDPVLAPYLEAEFPPRGESRRWQRLRSFFGGSRSPLFIQETEEAVRRLEIYGGFAHGSEDGGTAGGSD
jgi:hypothetical protein